MSRTAHNTSDRAQPHKEPKQKTLTTTTSKTPWLSNNSTIEVAKMKTIFTFDVQAVRSKWEAALYEGFILYINLKIEIIFRLITSSAD